MKDAKLNKIQLCALDEWPSLGHYLKEWLGFSNQKLKSFYHKGELARAVAAHRELSLPLGLINDGLINPLFKSPRSVHILAETESVLALSKPYQLHGHPLNYEERESLLNFLRQERADICWDQFPAREKGLLYRLDYETSGLVLFIKDPSLHRELRASFKNMVKEKIYYALAQGRVEPRAEVVHGLSSCGPKGALVKVDPLGEEARLEIVAAHYFEAVDASLVKICLHSGQRHQIRVQLKALGHALVGDPLYSERQAQRLYLHCYSYQLRGDIYCDPKFDLLGHYLGLDGRLQMFGDELLIGESGEA